MIIDDRVGSIECLRPLRRMGVPVRAGRLRCADFAFTGRGPNRSIVSIGIERKTVSEFLGMMRGDRRFYKKQLPRLLKRYQYVWLVVEGYTQIDKGSGLLMLGQWEAGHGGQRYTYEEYTKALASIAIRAKVFVKETKNFTETIHYLHALYGWWQKPYDAHTSVLHVDSVDPDRVIIDHRTFTRQILAQVPDIGWVRSKRVAQHFGSIQAACAGDVRAWREALGIKEGTTIIRRVMECLRGIEHGEKAKG